MMEQETILDNNQEVTIDNDHEDNAAADGNGTQQKCMRKRRLTFYAITPDFISYCKKVKMVELLLPITDDQRLIVPQSLELIKKLYALLMLTHAFGIPNTPMWVGFNSNFSEDYNTKKQKIRYLTPINESPTER